jgi:crotonobetainyl-CoA:carnitine CoA-transferase CaiB-like acyl-CoA transferase
VLDLTDLRGALAGRMLADLGADVVKVEPPRGDDGRLRAPFAGGVEATDRSLPFLYRNANKRGAVIDLHSDDGWHRFCGLCERADILIENFGPEGQRRHGLTPAEVHERHPHLIHVALADFGLSGPRAGWRLEALPAFAASGALWASGFPDRPPCWLPGYAAHDAGSVFAVAGALAAVLDRARHGEGQTVEVSVQEAALNALNP